MTFNVAADAYDSFMGRFPMRLQAQPADLAGIERGRGVIDVGGGPGALTTELVRRLGPDAVAAADPSEPFVEAARERHPGVDVRLAPAENLPFDNDSFDAALAQLVVHFMADPVAGLAEMARVTHPGGVVAASVWDLAGGRAPISPFWQAARELDPGATDESNLAGARDSHLAELFTEAGPRDVQQPEPSSTVEYETFEGWWAGGVLVRRYARETYCNRFQQKGWIYRDGALKLAAQLWLQNGGTCAEGVAGQPAKVVPCKLERGGGVLTLDCGLLRVVRRSEVRSYLRRLQVGGPVACEGAIPLARLGIP